MQGLMKGYDNEKYVEFGLARWSFTTRELRPQLKGRICLLHSDDTSGLESWVVPNRAEMTRTVRLP